MTGGFSIDKTDLQCATGASFVRFLVSFVPFSQAK